MSNAIHNLKRSLSEEGSSSSRLPPSLRSKNSTSIPLPRLVIIAEKPTKGNDQLGLSKFVESTTEDSAKILQAVPRAANSDYNIPTISNLSDIQLSSSFETDQIEAAECLALLLPTASSPLTLLVCQRDMDSNTSSHDTFVLAHVPKLDNADPLVGSVNSSASTTDSISLYPHPMQSNSSSSSSNSSSASNGDREDKQDGNNLRITVLHELSAKCAASTDIVANPYYEPLPEYSSDMSQCSCARNERTHTCCAVNHWMAEFWKEWLDNWHPLQGKTEIGTLLGTGRSGSMYRGKFNGSSIAFKLCPMSKSHRVLAEVDNEVAIYSALSDLQGQDIPFLYCHGLLTIYRQLHMVLVLELIEDTIPVYYNEDRETAIIRRCPLKARCAALEALNRIHAAGVLQGDPRAENIIFKRDHGSGDTTALQPKLIDFAFGSLGASPQRYSQEMREWRSILYVE